MIPRILFLCIFIICLPLILFLICLTGIAFLIFFTLVKFGIVNISSILNSKFVKMAQQKKPFFETTFHQISCKHTNLEQQDAILICSDCGKIIQHHSA